MTTLLLACSGGTASDGSSARQQLRAQSQLQASDYQNVVQALYVAYFGRPADPTGEANFENALLAANAPTDLVGLSQAYGKNPAVRSLIDSFGTSQESASLYGGLNANDVNAFVASVFQNLLGRQPQQAGLTFWSGQINSKLVTPGSAALEIMVGAMSNTSAQGVLDAQLIGNRLTEAADFTKLLAAQNRTAGYAGTEAAAIARIMLAQVTADTSETAFAATLNDAVSDFLVITTVAGNDSAGFSGDGGPATSASFNGIAGVAVDAAGNLYVADPLNNRIRKVTPAGIVSTVAGTGVAGFSGDNGPATQAQINNPTAMAVDASGNLYFGDAWNHRIRKITTGGTISTIAGDGAPGSNGDNGPAVSAEFGTPLGILVDGRGNIYVSDGDNWIVRKITPDGIISTFAGDRTGTKGAVIGDGGPATSASLGQPRGLTMDASGNVYIADCPNGVVRMVDSNGIITTAVGTGSLEYAGANGSALGVGIGAPIDLAIDATGNMYILNSSNNVRKIDFSGNNLNIAGILPYTFSYSHSPGDNGPATEAQFGELVSMAVGSSGNVYLGDASFSVVRMLQP